MVQLERVPLAMPALLAAACFASGAALLAMPKAATVWGEAATFKPTTPVLVCAGVQTNGDAAAGRRLVTRVASSVLDCAAACDRGRDPNVALRGFGVAYGLEELPPNQPPVGRDVLVTSRLPRAAVSTEVAIGAGFSTGPLLGPLLAGTPTRAAALG